MKKIFAISLSFLLSFAVIAQDDFKGLFNKVTGYMYDENYIDAMKLLVKLDSIQPNNANVQFQMGLCYHYSRTEGAKAIPYFQKASKEVNPEYKDSYYKETGAPPETWLFLGDALHKFYKFDEAIEAYYKYREYFDEADTQIDKDIDYKVKTCNNAKKLVAKPINLKIENLGDSINSKYAEYKPLISADESVLIFTSRRSESTGGQFDETGKYYEDIYIAENNDGHWSKPKNIGVTINTDDHEATAGLSADGQRLFVYKFVDGSGDIYVSTLNGATWSEPVKMGSDINTLAWEPYASISPDDELFFFTSDREGGMGGRDLYYCKRLPTGEWGLAINMGPNFNTPYDEDGPFLHPDGKTLYFSSKGHNSMGGFDIMYSEMQEDGTWGKPINMGYPANTTGDDVFFTPTSDGKRAYYSSFREDGKGDQDLYLLSFPDIQEKSLAIYKGVIKERNGAIPEDVVISVSDYDSGDMIGEYKPNSATGKYLIVLQPGRKYKIDYVGKACFFFDDYIEVLDDHQYHVINRAIDIKELEVGEVINLESIYFEYGLADLKMESEKQLDALVSLMKKCEKLTIEIGGHTDSHGDDNYNMKLSQDRSQSVVDYIVKHGIAAKRLTAKGYGETKPIAPNENEDGSDNEEGRALNRRTEMKVTGI